jgi:hypothetical protein
VSRCGSDGIKSVKKDSILLQLEQTGHRSSGSGLLVSGHKLGRMGVPISVPSIQSYRAMSQQDQRSDSEPCVGDLAILAREALVQPHAGADGGHQEVACLQDSGDGLGHREPTSGHCIVSAGRLSSFWQDRQKGLSVGATKLVDASWRKSTETQYSSCWRKWTAWATLHGISATSPALSDVLNFLAELYDLGLQYRTINTVRSTLSSTLSQYDGYLIGQHPLVTRLMKGIFNSRPAVQKLFPTWSVKTVLLTLKTWSPASSLSLKLLSLKTIMLVALATGKRASSIKLLTTKSGYIEISEGKIVMQPLGLEKHSRLDKSFPPITLTTYNEDPCLCPVFYLKAYLKRTEHLRSTESLFVTITRPHEAASVATLLRWLKTVISQSGQHGPGGSVRSVTTSTAIGVGVTIEKVLKAGDWSRASTFKNFYYKPVPIDHLQQMASFL